MPKKRKRTDQSRETEPEPEEAIQLPPRVEESTDEMAERLSQAEKERYITMQRILDRFIDLDLDVILSRDLTYNIMNNYPFSIEDEDRLIREEIDKYEESTRAQESTRGLIESHIASMGDPPPTHNPPEGESVFGVPQVAPPQVDPVTQAFDDLNDTLDGLPPDDILELKAEDPDAVPNPFEESRLKAKRSKKRKKKRKSKRRKSKRRKSKRKVSKRKKKKKKLR